jgi:alcohol/geraniol dehydrogenase (NADP+)
VEYCGICHSDQSMIDNEWGNARYPFIPGHEVVGTVVRLGPQARGLKLGQRVGIGWYKGSCMHCSSCMEGSHQLCGTVKPTIVGSNGGFADRLRSHWAWAVPLPDGLDPALVGPLFCAGSTVFSPLLDFDVKPTDKVGVVGIGGLGHLALGFLNAWGCEVTAFTSSLSKQEEAKRLGAHKVVASTDSAALKAIAASLDFLLVTASADLDWNAMIGTLRGKGRLHFVGIVPSAIPVHVFNLIPKQKSLSGSPVGSPSNMATMLEFCARHQILPQVEHFPMSKVNEAIDHLRAGKARYRVVLDASC